MEVTYKKKPYIRDKIDLAINIASTEGRSIKNITLSHEEWEDFIAEYPAILGSWSFNGSSFMYNGVSINRKPGIGIEQRGFGTQPRR